MPLPIYGFRETTNLKTPHTTLFSAKLHHGCEITATTKSCAYFSLPDKIDGKSIGRRCLLSVSLQFFPSQGASIANFSISLDIAPEATLPPTVEGFKFLNLEDTAFNEDFRVNVTETPSILGPKWFEKNYESILCGTDDVPYVTGSCHTYIWAERRLRPTLTIRGDGFVGAPDSAVQTVPLCILLAFAEPLPPFLSANVCLRAKITTNRDGRLLHGLHPSVVSCHRMQKIILAAGPERQLIRGDPTYLQPSRRIRDREDMLQIPVGGMFKQSAIFPACFSRKKRVLLADMRQGKAITHQQLSKNANAVSLLLDYRESIRDVAVEDLLVNIRNTRLRQQHIYNEEQALALESALVPVLCDSRPVVSITSGNLPATTEANVLQESIAPSDPSTSTEELYRISPGTSAPFQLLKSRTDSAFQQRTSTILAANDKTADRGQGPNTVSHLSIPSNDFIQGLLSSVTSGVTDKPHAKPQTVLNRMQPPKVADLNGLLDSRKTAEGLAMPATATAAHTSTLLERIDLTRLPKPSRPANARPPKFAESERQSQERAGNASKRSLQSSDVAGNSVLSVQPSSGVRARSDSSWSGRFVGQSQRGAL